MHTPGPFEVDLSDIPDFIVERDIVAPNGLGEGSCGFVVGRVTVCRASDELRGNAKLLAAAPDLLEACEGMQLLLCTSLREHADEPWAKMVNAAIAKAANP